MPAQIERPQFYEGQLLGPNDLEKSLDYNRDQNARHARVSHTWGIGIGLGVEVDGGALTVGPGMGIDSSGAAIVVPESATLEDADFIQDLPSRDPDFTHYPLYLRGDHRDAPNNRPAGRCGGAASTRRTEGFVFEFGDPTFLANWDQQQEWPIAKGPDDQQSRRPLLLGFAVWDESSREFTGFESQHLQNGRLFRPRYIGVRGDTLQSTSGKITLHSQAPQQPGAPVVAIDADDDDATFAFGLDDGQGQVKKPALVTIDKKGNLSVLGAISGAARVGHVLIASGTATHGVRPPLPDGVTGEQIDSGDVLLHSVLTPRPDLSVAPDPTPDKYFAIPDICTLSDQRVIQCRFRWIESADVTKNSLLLGGTCDYLLIATVNSSDGSTT